MINIGVNIKDKVKISSLTIDNNFFCVIWTFYQMITRWLPKSLSGETELMFSYLYIFSMDANIAWV